MGYPGLPHAQHEGCGTASPPPEREGYRAYRRRSSLPAVVVALGVLVVAVGFAALVVKRQGDSSARQRTEQHVVAQAHKLVAPHLGATGAVTFEAEYVLTELASDQYQFVSHAAVVRGKRTQRQQFNARLQRAAGAADWQLVQLSLDGKPVDLSKPPPLSAREMPADLSTMARGSGTTPTTFEPFAGSPSTRDSSAGAEVPEGTVARAISRIAADIRESARLRPTLVVWLIDQSLSAQPLRENLLEDFGPVLDELRASQGGSPGERKNLQLAIIGYGSQTQLVVDPPTSDPDVVRQGLSTAAAGTSDKEMTFAALDAAAARYGSFTAQGGYVRFVLVSDERGDDEERLEEVLARLRRTNITVHAIGPEAPLGRDRWVAQERPSRRGGEQVAADDLPRQGPETLHSEHIRLEFWNRAYADDTQALPSGFGPFSLARLCNQTDGTYFVCAGNPAAAQLPRWARAATEGVQFHPAVRNKYAPDYVSPAEYQQLLDENAARRAVHEAAKVPDVEVARTLIYEFQFRDEADLKNQLDMAQREVARLEPKIEALYEKLKLGEKDRPRLSGPRWQAQFDLAWGRTLASKVRIEGYNAMLAQLKLGRKFQRPESTIWVIHPADTLDAGSTFERLMKDARRYLERVKTEHPGTPWAYLAERELQTKLGWEWRER
jgi:hypothetical protein